MSIAKNVLILSPPLFLVDNPIEHQTFAGFTCPICNGAGWKWDPEVIHERVKITCPFCKGEKRIIAKVTIQWTTINTTTENE